MTMSNMYVCDLCDLLYLISIYDIVYTCDLRDPCDVDISYQQCVIFVIILINVIYMRYNVTLTVLIYFIYIWSIWLMRCSISDLLCILYYLRVRWYTWDLYEIYVIDLFYVIYANQDIIDDLWYFFNYVIYAMDVM